MEDFNSFNRRTIKKETLRVHKMKAGRYVGIGHQDEVGRGGALIWQSQRPTPVAAPGYGLWDRRLLHEILHILSFIW